MGCFRFRLCDLQWSFVRHGSSDFQVSLCDGLDYGVVLYVVCWWFWAFLEGVWKGQRISRFVH